MEKELEFQYDNFPPFCDHCSMIGHDKLDCRNLKRMFEGRKRDDDKNQRQRSRSKTRQAFRQKTNHVEDEKVCMKQGISETLNLYASLNDDLGGNNINIDENNTIVLEPCYDKENNNFNLAKENHVDNDFNLFKETKNPNKREDDINVKNCDVNVENIVVNTIVVDNIPIHESNAPAKSWADISQEENEENESGEKKEKGEENEDNENSDEDNEESDSEEEFHIISKGNGSYFRINPHTSYPEIVANLKKFIFDNKDHEKPSKTINYLKIMQRSVGEVAQIFMIYGWPWKPVSFLSVLPRQLSILLPQIRVGNPSTLRKLEIDVFVG